MQVKKLSKKIMAGWENKLKSGDPIVREKLAFYLGRKKTVKKASQILVRLLSDSEPLVRSEAVKSLLKVGNKKNLADVLPLLDDKDEVVRVNAVECIATLWGSKALESLIRCLGDKSELVRSYSAGCVGEIGDKSQTKYLERRLKEERSGLAKVGLFEGLYHLGQEDKLLSIIGLLKHRRYHVRCSVANVLTHLVNKKNSSLIQDALEAALNREATIAAKSSITNALRVTKKLNKNYKNR